LRRQMRLGLQFNTELGGERIAMSEWRDTLLTTSEIAITIAGFAGLVGVLGRPDRIGRSSLEFFRLRSMLEYSFFALGYSLLPFLVFSAGFDESASWRASSLALATLLLISNALALPFEPSAFPYVAAVYLHLFGSAVGLFRLIALVWSPSDQRGGE
jgi:hypothetical protein